MEDIGQLYQEASKYYRYREPGSAIPESPPREALPGRDTLPRFTLPPPESKGGMPLWETIASRRSLRRYTAEALAPEDLSQLLWATQGITHPGGRRVAPSAGACYPLETYLAVLAVKGLAHGLYHYLVEPHALECLAPGDYRERVRAAARDQRLIEKAAVVFLWKAVVERTRRRYHLRAYRYIYLDAGHIGQSLYLAATALGLGCCAIGAFYDDAVDALIGADGAAETVVYMAAVGRIAP